MNWLTEAFLEPSMLQTIVIISSVASIGIFLGHRKIFGISLGITFVFFVGIIVGHLGINVNKELIGFAQNFGLILFVYSLGLQVGPGFFSSFKKGGIALNIMALGVVAIGLILTIALHFITGISFPNMIGIMTGAVTNTPALGAAQQALLQINPDDYKGVADMALACAVTYPLGVVGVILAVIVLKSIFKRKKVDQEITDKKAFAPFIAEYQVCNPAVYEKTIKSIMKLTQKKFVISRIWRNGKVEIPTSETILTEGDRLLVISKKEDSESIILLFGKQENVDWNNEDIDWNAIDSHLISRRIIITNDKINGVKLGSLNLRNTYGINITRINRAGIDLLASPDLHLQIGDRLTIVGEAKEVKEIGKLLGNELRRLDNPNLIVIFTGILFGVLLGALPIPFPGITLPIKLGIAGGPIIVGILMGAFGPRLNITTYTTQSANLMMRHLGIVIYLAALGIISGEHFFETIFKAEGLLWIGLGFILTIVPVLIMGYVSTFFFKLGYEKNIGMLCGSMANPMALNYANTIIDSDDPSVAYATVYPVCMFIRVITAQIILLFFM